MKKAWTLFTKHPTSIICLLLYTFIIVEKVIVDLRFERALKQHPEGGNMVALGGEGAGMYAVFLTFAAIIFAGALGIKAITSQKEKKNYYLWLLLIVGLETVIGFSTT